MADKVLMTVLVGSLTFVGLVPMWLAALIIGRDVALIGGTAYVRYKTLPYPVRFVSCCFYLIRLENSKALLWLEVTFSPGSSPNNQQSKHVAPVSSYGHVINISHLRIYTAHRNATYAVSPASTLFTFINYNRTVVATTTVWSALHYFINRQTVIKILSK